MRIKNGNIVNLLQYFHARPQRERASAPAGRRHGVSLRSPEEPLRKQQHDPQQAGPGRVRGNAASPPPATIHDELHVLVTEPEFERTNALESVASRNLRI